MKFILVCSCLLLLLAFGSVQSQLLIPSMVCQMQCLQKMNAPQSLTYDDPRAQKCRQYCLEHAYDNLWGLTTTTPKPKESV